VRSREKTRGKDKERKEYLDGRMVVNADREKENDKMKRRDSAS
jgi:hypothetical protein